MFSFILFLLRLSILNSNVKLFIFQKSTKFFLSQSIFFLFLSFTTLNFILDFYQEVLNISLFDSSNNNFKSIFFLTMNFNKILSPNSTSLNLLDVYLYPFIYVFLLITILSVVFCMTYNKDELVSFMFYCQTILLAGYFLFFTNSLIVFFFSYEMLLVHYFFILYKFAKTRRCVEAAYLMFF
jgi:hypothetical protein